MRLLASLARVAAKTPDSVDRLIQGILEGTGKGGVVTNEFNRDGVHATIISNVNELRVRQIGGQALRRSCTLFIVMLFAQMHLTRKR